MLYYFSPVASGALYVGSGVPQLKLAELLTGQSPESPALPILGIERLLGPFEVESPLAETAVTPADLRLAYDRLKAVENGGSPQASSRSHYLGRLRERFHEPTHQAILEHIHSVLPLSARETWVLDRLSSTAQEGLYLLTLSLPLPELALRKFLRRGRNKKMRPLVDEVLRLVLLLYDRGIDGYAAGFYRSAFDRKFLSNGFGRLNSLRTEYQQALWIASNSDATEVILSPRLPIDWHSLTDPEHEFIVREILPKLDEGLKWKFAGQTSVEVDILVGRNGKGRRRVVEVKTTSQGPLAPVPGAEAEMLLQVFRHALLARQNGLEGVEYAIVAEDVNEDFLGKLQLALETTQSPYMIRFELLEPRKPITHNLQYPFLDRPISEVRRRPLPRLPGRRAA